MDTQSRGQVDVDQAKASIQNLSIHENGPRQTTPPHNSERETDRDVNQKREDYLSWPDYFMAVAFLSAMRSKDPSSQVRI